MFVVPLFSLPLPNFCSIFFIFCFPALVSFSRIHACTPIPRLKPPVNGQHIDNRFQFVPGNNNKKSIVFSKLNAGYNTIRVQTNKQTGRQAGEKSPDK